MAFGGASWRLLLATDKKADAKGRLRMALVTDLGQSGIFARLRARPGPSSGKSAGVKVPDMSLCHRSTRASRGPRD